MRGESQINRNTFAISSLEVMFFTKQPYAIQLYFRLFLLAA